jgi:two-component system, NarL family, sensor histidine kinase DesK
MNSRSPFGPGWWGLAFSLSGLAVLIDPMRRQAGTMDVVLAIAGAAMFIALFFCVVWDWKRGRSGLWQTTAIVLLGGLFAPGNPLGWIFFLVAIAFAPSVADGNVRNTALIVFGVIAVALIEKLALGLPWSFLGPVVGYGIPTAAMTTVALRRNVAVRELARHSERERISRDMHDVLGHTLSVIVLKTDLAARVAHDNPDRAVQELNDVQHLTRQTLDEVRQTLRGYRVQTLEQEMKLACQTLSSTGAIVATKFNPPSVDPAQESVLCLALREGVTNIVRHAQATHCRLSVTASGGDCVLEIEDNGKGMSASDGSQLGAGHEGPQSKPLGAGLMGMRDRVVASGGMLTLTVQGGTRLTIRVPASRAGDESRG